MTPWTADVLRALRENNETTWTSSPVPTHLHEMIVSLYQQNDELRRRVADADEEIVRLRRLATEAINTLIAVCNWRLEVYDGDGTVAGYSCELVYDGIIVEAFARRWAVRVDAPRPADFAIDANWRSILGLDDDVQP